MDEIDQRLFELMNVIRSPEAITYINQQPPRVEVVLECPKVSVTLAMAANAPIFEVVVSTINVEL